MSRETVLLSCEFHCTMLAGSTVVNLISQFGCSPFFVFFSKCIHCSRCAGYFFCSANTSGEICDV